MKHETIKHVFVFLFCVPAYKFQISNFKFQSENWKGLTSLLLTFFRICDLCVHACMVRSGHGRDCDRECELWTIVNFGIFFFLVSRLHTHHTHAHTLDRSVIFQFSVFFFFFLRTSFFSFRFCTHPHKFNSTRLYDVPIWIVLCFLDKWFSVVLPTRSRRVLPQHHPILKISAPLQSTRFYFWWFFFEFSDWIETQNTYI